MKWRTLALTALVAGGTTFGATVPESPSVPFQRGPSRAEDPPSISAFVAALRGEAERDGSPARSLQEALSRVVPELRHLPRCLTPITQEISRQAPSSPALASFTSPVLSAPVLPRESIFATPEGGDFAIHYTLERSSGDGVLASDRDGNGAPDYVDLVASSLIAARRQLVGSLGFRDGESPSHVYLANLGGRVDGYAVRANEGRPAFLVIDSRLLGNDSLLRAAVSHQYAHSVLQAYAEGAPAWWEEASATWLEGLAAGSYTHYTDPIQASLDQAAAGLAHDDARLLPGRMLWPAFLSSFAGRRTIVREIWENLAPAGDASDLWSVTDQVLRSSGSNLEEAFAQYTIWLLLSGERSDGRHFPFADRLKGVPLANEYAAYPASEIQTSPMLAPMGAAFVRFESDGSEGGLHLSFEGDLPGTYQAQLLLKPRRDDDPLVRAVVPIDARGRGSIGIPWGTYSEAVLVIGNVSRAGAPASYSFVATPDPDFPFEITSFSAEPEEGDVRVTWETRSEDDLFGWIVYRVDRIGASPHRVNDLPVPAIGDGDGPVSYQYLDDSVLAGRTYYYRLVGVTHEGLTREVPEARVDIPR